MKLLMLILCALTMTLGCSSNSAWRAPSGTFESHTRITVNGGERSEKSAFANRKAAETVTEDRITTLPQTKTPDSVLTVRPYAKQAEDLLND